MLSVALLTASLLSVANSQCFINSPGTLVQERRDPIVNPGVESFHLHDIAGPNTFNANMTYEDTQRATCTTNSFVGDYSAYWVASLFFHRKDGGYELVSSNKNQTGRSFSIYYFNDRTGDDKVKVKAFVPGFRMISGDPSKTAFNGTDYASQATSFTCSGSGPMSQQPSFPTREQWKCNDALRAQHYFPNCWNGKLDPAGRSHMTYATIDSTDPDRISGAAGSGGGKCPASHPIRTTTLFYERYYNVNDFWPRADEAMNPDQPFVFSFGDSLGYGHHADYVFGWSPNLLDELMVSCNPQNTGLDTSKCRINNDVKEDTGVNGNVLAALPGQGAAPPNVSDVASNKPSSAQRTADFSNKPSLDAGPAMPTISIDQAVSVPQNQVNSQPEPDQPGLSAQAASKSSTLDLVNSDAGSIISVQRSLLLALTTVLLWFAF